MISFILFCVVLGCIDDMTMSCFWARKATLLVLHNQMIESLVTCCDKHSCCENRALLCCVFIQQRWSCQHKWYITQAMRRLLPLIHWYYFSTLLNLSAFSSTEDYKELCTINTFRVCTPQHFTLHWQTQQAIVTTVNRAIIKSFFLIDILHYQYCTTWLVQYTLHLRPLKLT